MTINVTRTWLRRRCPTVVLALVALASSVGPATVASADSTKPAEVSAADEMRNIRQTYLDIRRDWRAAQPSGVVPGVGEFGIYLTVDSKTKATLEEVSVAVDGRLACTERYGDQEMAALRLGAASRLCVEKLAPGTTEVMVTFTGTNGKGEPWTQMANVDLPHARSPIYVRMALTRRSKKGIPEIVAMSSM